MLQISNPDSFSDSFPTSWIHFIDKVRFLNTKVPSKNSRCLLPGSGMTKSWSMFVHALRAKNLILVSVGVDSSPPKPLSSGSLNCLRRISTFSGRFLHLDRVLLSIPLGGVVFCVYVFKPQGLSTFGSCVGQPFLVALRTGSASVLFELVRVTKIVLALVLPSFLFALLDDREFCFPVSQFHR